MSFLVDDIRDGEKITALLPQVMPTPDAPDFLMPEYAVELDPNARRNAAGSDRGSKRGIRGNQVAAGVGAMLALMFPDGDLGAAGAGLAQGAGRNVSNLKELERARSEQEQEIALAIREADALRQHELMVEEMGVVADQIEREEEEVRAQADHERKKELERYKMELEANQPLSEYDEAVQQFELDKLQKELDRIDAQIGKEKALAGRYSREGTGRKPSDDVDAAYVDALNDDLENIEAQIAQGVGSVNAAGVFEGLTQQELNALRKERRELIRELGDRVRAKEAPGDDQVDPAEDAERKRQTARGSFPQILESMVPLVLSGEAQREQIDQLIISWLDGGYINDAEATGFLEAVDNAIGGGQ